jgi:uncharacterized membrane protein YkoI
MNRFCLLLLALSLALTVSACADTINAADMSSGSRASAIALGITNTPITADQARAIAEKETGGVAIEVEGETEDGVPVFEVEVRVGSDSRQVIKEVVIRASDGAVLEVEIEDEEEDDDGDDDEDDGAEGGKEDSR